jgi:hypothetical protein
MKPRVPCLRCRTCPICRPYQGPCVTHRGPVVALHREHLVHWDDSLAGLLGALAGIVDPGIPEDVVVWDAGRVLAVVRHTGAVVMLAEPEARP